MFRALCNIKVCCRLECVYKCFNFYRVSRKLLTICDIETRSRLEYICKCFKVCRTSRKPYAICNIRRSCRSGCIHFRWFNISRMSHTSRVICCIKLKMSRRLQMCAVSSAQNVVRDCAAQYVHKFRMAHFCTPYQVQPSGRCRTWVLFFENNKIFGITPVDMEIRNMHLICVINTLYNYSPFSVQMEVIIFHLWKYFYALIVNTVGSYRRVSHYRSDRSHVCCILMLGTGWTQPSVL